NTEDLSNSEDLNDLSNLIDWTNLSNSLGQNFNGLRSGGKGGFGGGMGAANGGGSLVYTDDEISSYSSIFGNAVGGDADEDSCNRVIAALKALNDGENIEKYFDVDEILRYLAVHSFVVNLDSYSSNMAQNYYIYEQDGYIQILPWDYNYAWGAFQGGTASSTVNFPVDTPVSGVEMSERPLISKLFENEEYLARYHSYLNELVETYFTDGKFNAKLDELDNLIGTYVQSDPTAFYTYEEYQTAVNAFKVLGNLRAESVSGQLSGTVPSTTEEQKTNSDKLVDSSSVTMSELGMSNSVGGMGGGFGGGNFGGRDFGNSDRGDFQKFDENGTPPELPNGETFGNNTGDNDMQTPPNLPGGENFGNNTEGNGTQTPPNLPDGENFGNNTEGNGTQTPPNLPNENSTENNAESTETPPQTELPDSNNSENNTDSNTEQTMPNLPNGENFKNKTGGNNMGNQPDFGGNPPAASEETSGIGLTVGSAVLLIAAIIGVSFVKSKF
ncbi:MAG: CotH kinase family protein, partial [Muribaculaceae bacterium]|nr:CotH kinase family protein [Muribaculaceae bacterium]